MPEYRWKIELFGGVRAQDGARSISRFRTAKTGSLLAYLASHGGRRHSRDELIELLWPETDPLLGRNSLSQALSSLRNQLEPPGMPPGSVLTADRRFVGLNPSAFSCDVARFRTAVVSAHKSTSTHQRERHLGEALLLYRGEFAHGWYDDWVLTEREALQTTMLGACKSLMDLHQERSEWDQAVLIAKRATDVAPNSAAPLEALVRLYACAGRAEQAIDAYDRLCRLLREECASSPDPALTRLVRSLEKAPAGSREVDSAPAADGGLQAAGEPLPALRTATVTLMAVRFRRDETSLRQFHRVVFRNGGESFRSGADPTAQFGRATEAVSAGKALIEWAIKRGDPETVPGIAIFTTELGEDGASIDLELQQPLRRLMEASTPGQILCAEASAALLRPRLHNALAELGTFRLAEDRPPERVFEVLHDHTKALTSPGNGKRLRLEASRSDNLPLSLSRFCGREQELHRLTALLCRSAVDDGAAGKDRYSRLVTLTGPGGTGKTRLSVEFARRAVSQFQLATWFVTLAALSDPRLIPDAIVEALGVPRSARLSPLDQAVLTLSHSRALLVLDNLEQLIDPSGEAGRIITTLLERAPQLQCLVTSRRRLGITGERIFPLGPLHVPTGFEAPAELLEFGSVQLFTDRAQSVRPDFQITSANVGAVAELCTRLEGVPLALELAAVRCQALSPAHILARLEKRLDEFKAPKQQKETRHETLRAAIDWSFQLLDPQLQRFFARLSVFRGSWSLEAVEAIVPEPGESASNADSLDVLMQLQECSLIHVDAVPDDADASPRFRMLETLREFSEEMLPEREGEQFRLRHAGYFLSLAEEQSPRLQGEGQLAALSTIECDYENLRQALHWSRRSAPEICVRLAAACWSYWQIRGRLFEGRAQLEQVIECGGPAGAGWAEVLYGAGELAADQADYPEVRRLLDRCVAAARACGALAIEGRALQRLAMTEFEQGDYAKACSIAEEALRIGRAENEPWITAAALNTLGVIACERGEYDRSADLHTQALELRRQIGETGSIASSINNLGIIARRRGDTATAERCYEECLALHESRQNTRGRAAALSNLGLVAADRGELDRAHAFYEQSLALRRELGDQWGIGLSLTTLGEIAREKGDLVSAEALLAESLGIRRALGDRRGTANTLNALGRLECRRKQWREAASDYREALRTLTDLGDRPGMVDSLEGIALAAAAGNPSRFAGLLLGAAGALREVLNRPFTSAEEAEQAAFRSRLQSDLEAEEFAAALEEGRKITLAEAVETALTGA